MPAAMQAVRFDSAAGTLTLDEVPTPTPDVDEVVVKVAATGICKSDLYRIDGVVQPRMQVYTPGHEAAGVVAAVGARVECWAVGDRVVMAAGRQCGECAACRIGAGSDGCTDLRMMAIHYDGAWAEYAVTSATSLVAVPDSIPLEQATVMSGAVSTPFGAIDTAALRPAEAVGVWGLGGLGTHLVQLARLCGASPIIALDVRPAARELALKRGADVALDPANTRLVSYIKAITKGRNLDVAFDFVSNARSFDQARAVLGDRGRLVMVGTSLDVAETGPEFTLIRNKQTILAHTGYHVKHLEDVVELVERGRLDLSASVSSILPLARVAEGLQRMREYDGNLLRLLLRP
ncbi:zinc-binding dehydrogenase [Amycolatopsis lurida NRRL 2430]|uniref:Zinc-binding dehydrogenase n=1 Tax=Amycolatopsis lurida NRRL 2430 TaxID=1460371 RepID=A0A2P2FGF0_AMYLU|nr:zinc-binding dehydrogenase [Amycolatopsis lurida NRRL 2430]